MTRRVFPDGPGPGKVMAYYTYDSAGRLAVLANRGPTFSDLINYFAYERNESGIPTRVEMKANAFTYFQQDQLDRQVRELSLNPIVTVYESYYSFDAASNRLQKTDVSANESTYYAYDSRNLPTQAWNKDTGATTYFDYDDAQRMVSTKVTAGQSTYFSHDQKDRITEVEFKGGSDDRKRFSYSCLGERNRITVGNPVSLLDDLTYDGRKLLTERNNISGVTLRRYRHNDQPNAGLGSDVEHEQGGELGSPAKDGCTTNADVLKDGGEGAEGDSRVLVFDSHGVKISDAGTFMDEQLLTFLSEVFVAVNNAAGFFLDGSGIWLPEHGLYSVGEGAGRRVGPTRTRRGKGTQAKPPVQQWETGLPPGVIEIQDTPLAPWDDDGDDPRDTPKATIYGEEIDFDCSEKPEQQPRGWLRVRFNAGAMGGPEPLNLPAKARDVFHSSLQAFYHPTWREEACCKEIRFIQVIRTDKQSGFGGPSMGKWHLDGQKNPPFESPYLMGQQSWLQGGYPRWALMFDSPGDFGEKFQVADFCAVCVMPSDPAATWLDKKILGCVTWAQGTSDLIGWPGTRGVKYRVLEREFGLVTGASQASLSYDKSAKAPTDVMLKIAGVFGVSDLYGESRTVNKAVYPNPKVLKGWSALKKIGWPDKSLKPIVEKMFMGGGIDLP